MCRKKKKEKTNELSVAPHAAAGPCICSWPNGGTIEPEQNCSVKFSKQISQLPKQEDEGGEEESVV